MRIGLIVGDPEVTDGFLQSSRPWLKDIPEKYVKGPKGPYAILKNDGELKDRVFNRNGRYVLIYMSVYFYLKKYYGHEDSKQPHHFDLIFPKDVTRERLMANDVNFYNFYDPIALASVDVKKGIEYNLCVHSR